jgi:hypothetical protein
MSWQKTISNEDCICFETKTKHVSSRIESRKMGTVWLIYHSYFTDNGLSFTQEYIASTPEHMRQILTSLQQIKLPTPKELHKLMLTKAQRLILRVEREFKEYGIEKWKFGLSSQSMTNFVLVKTQDQVSLDFVMHESLKKQEDIVIQEMLSLLGLDKYDEEITVKVSYITATVTKTIPASDDELQLF